MPVFLLDENVHKPDKIIERCAEQGIEVFRVHQFGLNRTDDPIILDYALEHDLVFVTANIKDFREQTIEWMQESTKFAGVIFLQGEKHRNVEGIIRKIIEVAAVYETAQYREWWL
jgi:predicted nuclease of predicted toxin-antitoxin system